MSDYDTKHSSQAATGSASHLTSASQLGPIPPRRETRLEERAGHGLTLSLLLHPHPAPCDHPCRPGNQGPALALVDTRETQLEPRTFFINLLYGRQLFRGPGGDDLRQHLLVRPSALCGDVVFMGEKCVHEVKKKAVFLE